MLNWKHKGMMRADKEREIFVDGYRQEYEE